MAGLKTMKSGLIPKSYKNRFLKKDRKDKKRKRRKTVTKPKNKNKVASGSIRNSRSRRSNPRSNLQKSDNFGDFILSLFN